MILNFSFELNNWLWLVDCYCFVLLTNIELHVADFGFFFLKLTCEATSIFSPNNKFKLPKEKAKQLREVRNNLMNGKHLKLH